MSEPFIGEIRLLAFNFAPRGWAKCDGQLLAISKYSALYSLLGTTYGGDGRTTFALPDLRGRAAIGEGEGPGLKPHILGLEPGAETVSLSIAHLPSHNHTLPDLTGTGTGKLRAVTVAADKDSPEGNYLAQGITTYHTGGARGQTVPTVDMHANAVEVTITTTGGVTDPTGGSQPFDNMQPSLVLSYCIALEGLYPSRS